MHKGLVNIAAALGAVLSLGGCSSQDVEDSNPDQSSGKEGRSVGTRSGNRQGAGGGGAGADVGPQGGDGTGGSVGGKGGAAGAGGRALGGAGQGKGGGSNDGGTPGTAGKGTAGAGGAGGAAPKPVNGYVVSGDWRGFAWATAVGSASTVTPTSFETVAAGSPLCVSGNVAAADDGSALLAVNLNQATESGSAPGTVVPKGEGITLNIDNKGKTPLRIQLQGPNGDKDEKDRWCATVVGRGGYVPWSTFNTRCWDNSGDTYQRQPLQAIGVQVPGSTAGARKFEYCLNALTEGDTTGGACNNGGSGTLMAQYEWAPVVGDCRNYVIQNNVWGASATQNVTFDSTTFTVTKQTGNNSSSAGPVSYPSLFIGSNHNRSTVGSNLPKLVSSIQSVKTTWNNNSGSINGQYNASYDVWFSTGATGDATTPSGGYLMVWYFRSNGINAMATDYNQPNWSNVSVAGKNWNVWVGNNNGKPVISYVATSNFTSWTFDLNAFIKDASTAARGTTINPSWYLTNVFAGFEIWNGGEGLKTSEFSVVVE